MEIFVSEKEINFKKILNNVGLPSDTKVITHTIHFISDKPFGEERTDTILASTTNTEVKSLEQHDRELLEELEVYKRALEEINWIYVEFGKCDSKPKYYKALEDVLNQARKELEDERK